jgi:hypothetical protein
MLLDSNRFVYREVRSKTEVTGLLGDLVGPGATVAGSGYRRGVMRIADPGSTPPSTSDPALRVLPPERTWPTTQRYARDKSFGHRRPDT